jgi:hypothetical protein
MTSTTTSARIDHKTHNHPATPAAREICRKAMRNGSGPAKVKKAKGGKDKLVVTKVKKTKRDDLPKVTEAKVMTITKDEVKGLIEKQGLPYPDDAERDAVLAEVREEVDARKVTVERVEDDGAPVVTGSAKGSKVVHELMANVSDEGGYTLRCTKQASKYTPVVADANTVTCKNCLK